jgi:ATP-dependent protease ClpP protease subunit
MMAAPDLEPGDRPRSAFEERLRGWMAASERRFEANMAASGDVLELVMLDIVGEDWWTGGGITSKGVQQKLAAYPKVKTIKVLLNSPGGDAFEGLAVQSLLRRHGASIEIEVVGLAASAASIIAMAGDTIAMHEGSLMMVHQPWTFAVGDADEMRTTAEFLDKVNSSGLDVYTRRTGRKREDVAELVAAETWMTAHEAVKEKFATSVVDGASPEPVAKARAAAQVFMQARKPRSAAQAPIEERQRALEEMSATPASPPVAAATPGDSRKGNEAMKTISLVAVMAALGYTVEQQASAEEKDVLDALGKVKQQAEANSGVSISGVKLLGVTSEAEATAKIQQLTRLNSALMAATSAANDAEALARVMAWKGAADREPEHVKQIGDLKSAGAASAKEAAIQKLSREGKLAPSMHDWARANFATAEALESFCVALPPMATLGAHEPSDPKQTVTLTAQDREVIAMLGIPETVYLEEKKLEQARKAARSGG